MTYNQTYLSFFEDAPDTILIFDQQSLLVIDINKKGCHTLGYSKVEILKLKLGDIVNKSELKKASIEFGNLKKGDKISNNLVFKSNTNSEIPFEVTSSLSSENHVISICREYSESKEKLSTLTESEEQMRLFVNYAPTAVAMFDKYMNYLNCSQKWVNDWSFNTKKVDKKTFIGKNHYDLFPDVTDHWKAIHKRSLNGEALSCDKEHFTNKNNEDVWLKWESVPWHDNKDEIGGIMLFTEIITEQVKIQDALIENEKQLRQIIDIVPNYIFGKDRNGNLILANKAFAELYGTTTEYIEKHGSLPKHSAPTNDLEKDFLSVDRKVIKTQKPVTTPIEDFTHASGKISYLQTTKVPYTAKDKTKIEVLGISTDITERIRFEEKIKKSDDRQKALLNAIPDLIFLNSVDGVYLDYHADHEKLLVKPEVFLGKNVKDLFHKDISEKFLKAFKLATSKEPQLVHYTLNVKGYPEHFEARIIKYDSNKILSIIRDITKQKNAETALKESREKLDFYFSKSLDGFYIMETDKPFKWDNSVNKSTLIKQIFKEVKIVKINDSMLGQYGGTLKEMIGYSLNDFFKHDLKRGYDIVSDLLDNGKQQNVTRELKLDGTPFWVEGDYVCLYNNEGLVRGLFGFQRDITDRIESEEDLKKITEDLIKSNNELQQFAYLTSHDLRAPVVNIDSLLKFYNKTEPNDKENPIIIEKIEESVDQLQTTLNDLVNIVALKKKDKEENTKISFSQVTKEIKSSINQEIKSSNAEIKTDFKVRSILYPKAQINSILQNILTNAIKYRSPKRTLKIGLKTYKQNEYTCLEISDNGLGIDMKKFGDKLFGIYQRFHNAPNSKGLGLYIVKTQVEQMGGYIEVKSQVNRGTTFYVFLNTKK